MSVLGMLVRRRHIKSVLRAQQVVSISLLLKARLFQLPIHSTSHGTLLVYQTQQLLISTSLLRVSAVAAFTSGKMSITAMETIRQPFNPSGGMTPPPSIFNFPSLHLTHNHSSVPSLPVQFLLLHILPPLTAPPQLAPTSVLLPVSLMLETSLPAHLPQGARSLPASSYHCFSSD